MSINDAGSVQDKSYGERLGHLGRILDEGAYRYVCIVEIESDLIARACSTPGREVDMIELPVSAVNPRVAGGAGKRGRYQALLSGIGEWFDRRGASNVVVTEGEGFMAVGGFAPYEAGDSGVMKGTFEELLLSDELAELARRGGASGSVAASIASNGSVREQASGDPAAGDPRNLIPIQVRQIGGRVRQFASDLASRNP